MRLLFVTQDYPPEVGGIQTYAREVAAQLAPRCAYFAVVAPAHPHAAAWDTRQPFPVHRVPVRSDLLPLALPWVLPRLAAAEHIDVTLHAQWQTTGAAVWARRYTGYPHGIVAAAHGRELLHDPMPTTVLRATYRAWRRQSLAAIDRFAPVSRFTGGLLQQVDVPAEKITVVLNGTHPISEAASDTAEWHDGGGPQIILTVARLVARKGVDTVLRALPLVAAAVPDVQYVVVGEGPARGRLETLAQELGIAARVRFAGRISEGLSGYFNACRVFAMPARSEEPDVEGFGLVFLEASAHGKPVVGSTSGGIPDAIRPGETGLVVPPDDPAALAEALKTLLTQPAYAHRLGSAGRAWVVARMNWARAGEELLAVCHRVMSSPKDHTIAIRSSK